MPSRFLPLLRAERFTECRELAEKMLWRVGHTTLEAAQAHHAIACCSLAEGHVAGGIRAGETALELSLKDQAWDLAGTVLIDLATAYGQARRHRQQIRKLKQYLAMFHRFEASRRHEVEAWYALGCALYLMGDLEESQGYLVEASLIANRRGALAVADQCRHLIRQAKLNSGSLETVPLLLAESEKYVQGHPDERLSACVYLFDLAGYLLADNRPDLALERALQAMVLAEGSTAHEVDCALLLHRCAVRQGRLLEAGSFLVLARLRALQGRRHDLGYDVTRQINQLIHEHGPSVLDGVDTYFDGSGMNPFQCIPDRLPPLGRTI